MKILYIKGEITENDLKEIKRIQKHNAFIEFERLWTLYDGNNLNKEQQKAVFEHIKKAYDFEAWNDLMKQITPLLENNVVGFNFMECDLK